MTKEQTGKRREGKSKLIGRPLDDDGNIELTSVPSAAPVVTERNYKLGPTCPRCRSLPPLRMMQQVPLIWICDHCTVAFDQELKQWKLPDAVVRGDIPTESTKAYLQGLDDAREQIRWALEHHPVPDAKKWLIQQGFSDAAFDNHRSNKWWINRMDEFRRAQ